MKILTPIIFMATSLFPEGTPLVKRVETLSRYINPPPGTTVEFDKREMRDQKWLANPRRLRGFISVSPPKGRCFIVTVTPHRPDERVCKSRRLNFTLEDLGEHGELEWTVKTGDGDFGTRLQWQTPYRKALVSKKPIEETGGPEPVFIEKCVASHKILGGRPHRQIILHLLSGERWPIYFPEKDQMLPQPPLPPNLYVADAFKLSLAAVASKREKKAANPEKTDGKSEKNSQNKKKGDAASSISSGRFEKEQGRDEWHLPIRDTYSMPASNFQPDGSLPGGFQKGECRYRFKGSQDDPKTGRIECHGSAPYDFFYAPLTCLKDLRQPTSSP